MGHRTRYVLWLDRSAQAVGVIEVAEDGWHGMLYVDEGGRPCELTRYADIEHFGPFPDRHHLLDAIKSAVRRIAPRTADQIQSR